MGSYTPVDVEFIGELSTYQERERPVGMTGKKQMGSQESLTLNSWDQTGLVDEFADLEDAAKLLDGALDWLKKNPRRKPKRVKKFYRDYLLRVRKKRREAKPEASNPDDYRMSVEEVSAICAQLLRDLEAVPRGRSEPEEPVRQWDCDHEGMVPGKPGSACRKCGIMWAQIYDAARINERQRAIGAEHEPDGTAGAGAPQQPRDDASAAGEGLFGGLDSEDLPPMSSYVLQPSD